MNRKNIVLSLWIVLFSVACKPSSQEKKETFGLRFTQQDLPKLKQMLQSKRWKRKVTALTEIYRLNFPKNQIVQEILPTLVHPKRKVRIAGIQILNQMKENSLSEIQNFYKKQPDSEKVWIVDSLPLYKKQTQEVLAWLEKEIDSSFPKLQFTIIQALSSIGTNESITQKGLELFQKTPNKLLKWRLLEFLNKSRYLSHKKMEFFVNWFPKQDAIHQNLLTRSIGSYASHYPEKELRSFWQLLLKEKKEDLWKVWFSSLWKAGKTKWLLEILPEASKHSFSKGFQRWASNLESLVKKREASPTTRKAETQGKSIHHLFQK